MRYGPERWLACSHCGGALRFRALLQVDARLAQLWSDGYVDSPSVPEQPLVVACGHCQGSVWLPELADATGSDGVDYRALTEEELWALTRSYGEELSEHQLHLRLKLWQLANHRHRRGESQVVWSDRERRNLERILGLLDLSTATEVMTAVEVSRQLGMFNQALGLLVRVEGELPAALLTQVEQRIQARDPRVFSVRANGEAGHECRR
ncbi:hypothetical protein [Ferrimonas futtsuensis]|uniref:hypothetical protein n=1 Tax=Ferrimonas futtsuensis TaxID=364764 RepID=UPI000407F50C|nr:hypothetical protein [Ferrimonas futtsuensis]